MVNKIKTSSQTGNEVTFLLGQNEIFVMENSTGIDPIEWEYYDDYLDPVIVDQNKLKYNRYSIVIISWIVLAAFVGFLSLSLIIMAGSGTFARSRRSKSTQSPRASTA